MPRQWITTPLPPVGSGGEQPDAAPGLIEPARAKVLRNAIITGPGVIAQMPDWLLGDTLLNPATEIPGPIEGHAVCGIFPFAQKGGASADSAGIAFHFNSDSNKVFIHQIGEDVKSLRVLVAFTGFTNALPPQMTGFEMFGKFYFVPYRPDEGVAARKGLHVFDPTGGGSVTNPTFVLGAGPAAVLQFRGISIHRGGTILGWGYRSESDADQPHVLRWSKYGAPDTWVPDTTDQTAGEVNVGTLKVPIVACAMSDQYTIIGKESEVFALDGDFSSQFYYRQIGRAHGPSSTVGMVSNGEAAVWLSQDGPAISVRGEKVELLAIDRAMRRFLSYLELSTAWGVHDATRNRVVWAVRRKEDEDGALVTSPFLTECFWWDYQRHAFGAHGLPSPIFSIGTIRGPGLFLPGPTGVVSALAASGITLTTAVISWTAGDTAPDVTFEVQWKKNGDVTWIPGGSTAPAVTSKTITGLPGTGSVHIDVRVRQVRNGLVSAYTQALDLFTTAAAAVTPDPAGVDASLQGTCFTENGIRFERVKVTWTPFSAPDTLVRLYQNSVNNFATATLKTSAVPGAGVAFGDYEAVGTVIYYWVRDEATDGSGGVSNAVQAATFPFTVTSGGEDCFD